MNFLPWKVATQLSSVLRSGTTLSQIFLLSVASGLGGGMPSTVSSSPGFGPAGGSTSSTEPSAPVAAKIMANDLMPRMAAGLRLQRTTQRRFCISSRGILGGEPPRPLMTCRGSASPTSIFSKYSESASGCFPASTMRPTRRSRRHTSGTTSSGALAPPLPPLPPFAAAASPPFPPFPPLPPFAFAAACFAAASLPFSSRTTRDHEHCCAARDDQDP
mmetsp:Transcript_21833/g.51971  ORF Transcript_21833/g.51971 Transcript_21833/m.51971 type:complete len:217 (+) Transcript_21833:79-729(+)